jgi:hypothetical protein
MANAANTKQPAPKKPSRKRTKKIDPAMRQQMIAEAAYYHAEQRGFLDGYALQDWLAAEEEIDRSM